MSKTTPLLHSRSDLARDREALLGAAVELLIQTMRRDFSISSLAFWVIPAIKLGQIKFLYDMRGEPVAYATWAFLSDDVSRRMERDDVHVMHISDWNEGLNLWLIDVVAPFGHAVPMIRLLRGLLQGDGYVRGIKRDKNGEMTKIVKRRRQTFQPSSSESSANDYVKDLYAVHA